MRKNQEKVESMTDHKKIVEEKYTPRKNKDVCKQGHLLTDENVTICKAGKLKDGTQKYRRVCKQCKRSWNAKGQKKKSRFIDKTKLIERLGAMKKDVGNYKYTYTPQYNQAEAQGWNDCIDTIIKELNDG